MRPLFFDSRQTPAVPLLTTNSSSGLTFLLLRSWNTEHGNAKFTFRRHHLDRCLDG